MFTPYHFFYREEYRHVKREGQKGISANADVSPLNKKSDKGFSTVELLIAMAIMSIILTGVVMVSFGTQGMLVGGETNAEAMNKAQELLEREQQLARKDFRLVVPFATTTDGIYQKSTHVESWPGDPYTTKRVTASVIWSDDRHIERSLSLTTLLSNFGNVYGADTCNAELSGNWAAPQKSSYQMTNADLGVPAGDYTVSAVDAYKGKLYVGVSDTGISVNAPTFFVFDISNPPQKPDLKGSVDNADTFSAGLNHVVAGNTVKLSGSTRTYAYGANANGALFNDCTAHPEKCAQLQVFDVTNATNPTLAASFRLATSSADVVHLSAPYVTRAIAGQAVANALFYRDGYVYMGLTKTGSGPEFVVIDVHDPEHPLPLSGYSVGRGVESIYVRGEYAYLATDDPAQDLVVLDIGDLTAPTQVTGTVYNPPGLNGGHRLWAVGDRLYFGKQFAGGSPEFHVLDITNSGAAVSSVSSKIIGASIRGLLVRDTLGFLLTPSQLQIVDLKNVGNPATTLPVPGDATALDCEGNYLYAASNNGGTGNISVIKPGT